MLLPMFAMFMWIWLSFSRLFIDAAVRTRELHPKFRTFRRDSSDLIENRIVSHQLFECLPCSLSQGFNHRA